MKVLLLALSGFELLEFSAFADVLGWAKLEGGLDIEYETAGFSREVRSTFGVPITVDRVLWRRGAGVCSPISVCAEDYDALAIPGGFEEYGYYEEAYRQDTAGLIRAFHKAGKPIASICVGALVLAHSGILEGRKIHLRPCDQQDLYRYCRQNSARRLRALLSGYVRRASRTGTQSNSLPFTGWTGRGS